ncbi:polymorphic toxin-type HINT domain-containing protein [Kitasatospora sp. NPDC058170]|uniref:polymorphic toxin-type HINT domain-containing protein n=1 Tax=Kitasatospora sp. NPDC058170 TaxID=3346364 RepID=UPI0036D9523A
MTGRGAVRRPAGTRARAAMGRGLCLALLTVFVPALATGESTAAPAADPPVPGLAALASGAPAPEPLRPSPAYPSALNSQVAAFSQQAAALPQRTSELMGATENLSQATESLQARSAAAGEDAASVNGKVSALNARSEALSGRIAAHNAAPHVFQLPAQAGAASAYDAEKAQLEGEAAQLGAERAGLESERSQVVARQQELAKDASKVSTDALALGRQATALLQDMQQLGSQREQLLQQMASSNQAVVNAPAGPPATTTSMAQGADAARPLRLADRSPAAADDRDHRQAGRKNAAVDAYAQQHGVKVIKRPVAAYLAPDAVSRLPAADLARLSPVATYDALVRKPNGHYKALEVWDPRARPGSGQEEFNSALSKGAQAVAAGGKEIIDEVESLTTCAPNSFPAGTRVLLADNTTRPIETIRAGDLVTAADPTAGLSGPRAVTGTIHTPDDRDFTELTIRHDDGTSGAITATDHHPFWVDTTRAWTDAAAVRVGDTLRTDAGATAQVASIRHWTGLAPAYNLTVEGLHTYFVLAGDTPVLVHNANPADCDKLTWEILDKLPVRPDDKGYTTGQPVLRTKSGTAGRWGGLVYSGSYMGQDKALVTKISDWLKDPRSGAPRIPTPNAETVYPSSNHVEAKVAWKMAENNKTVTDAEVIINNRGGVCKGDGLTCDDVVPFILCAGQTLVVIYQKPDGNLADPHPIRGRRNC